jgi:pimeloyl-ACP methyl ester carboxylesterase
MTMTNATYAPVAGGELHYEMMRGTGDNPVPLVLIHAGIADLRMWDAQIAPLAPYATIIRYDTRGYGTTHTSDPTVGFSNRQDIVDLLDHLAIPRAVIAGCSRGGQIAVDFALEFPARTLGLIPICGGLSGFDFNTLPPSPPEVAAFEQMDALEMARDLADPTERDGLAEQLARLEADVWVNGLYRPPGKRAPQAVYDYAYEVCFTQARRGNDGGTVITLAPPAYGRLSEIAAPTLVIVGAYDTKDTLAMADYMAQHIAGAGKVVIDEAAHLPNMEQPDAFNAAVIAFLKTITP